MREAVSTVMYKAFYLHSLSSDKQFKPGVLAKMSDLSELFERVKKEEEEKLNSHLPKLDYLNIRPKPPEAPQDQPWECENL